MCSSAHSSHPEKAFHYYFVVNLYHAIFHHCGANDYDPCASHPAYI